MAKIVLEENVVRNALASIAGSEPNGIFFTAIENKKSDAAVAAAFGAIGMAIAQSGRPECHIIHPTATGIFFIPVYKINKQFAPMPQQNFFIPNADIAQLTVVKGVIGGSFNINIKLQMGKKITFTGNKKSKLMPLQEQNFSIFHNCHKEQSKKAQKRVTAKFVIAWLFLIALFAFVGYIIATTEPDPIVDENGNYYTQTQSVNDLFTLEVPASFHALTEAELKEQSNENGVVIAGYENASGSAGIGVYRADGQGMTNDELIDGNLGNDEFTIVEINGVRMLKLKGNQNEGYASYNVSAVYFIIGDYMYSVFYSCNTAETEFSAAADTIINSIKITANSAAAAA